MTVVKLSKRRQPAARKSAPKGPRVSGVCSAKAWKAVRKKAVTCGGVSEDQLQMALVVYLGHALNGLPALFYAVPNGGARIKKEVMLANGRKRSWSPEAQKLKAMGARAGVADLVVVYDGRAIFLEVKTSSGALSDAQKAFRAAAEAARAPFYVVRSIDDVHAALIACGVPVKARPSRVPGRLYDLVA